MTNEIVKSDDLKPLTKEGRAFIQRAWAETEAMAADNPREIPTDQFVHAGCYVRTCCIPKDTVLIGAPIKIPTVVIVCGDCEVSTCGGEGRRLTGYRVFRGASGRQQCFIAYQDTMVTMIFGTDKTDLSECEEAFTDYFDDLLSRR